jgi:hypothetical protein
VDTGSATPSSGTLALGTPGSYAVTLSGVDGAGNTASGSGTLTINPASINLGDIAAGEYGIAINGQAAGDGSGWSVAGAGDVNGDGIGDLLIGARDADPAAGLQAGRSYVVFGRSGGAAAIDLSAVAGGSGGFVIDGQAAGDGSGGSVAAAGDVNGDGFADLVIGAPGADPAAGGDGGRSYVVFGRSATAAVALSAVAAGAGGFVIEGAGAGDGSGSAVSAAGDLNGDGLSDLVVAAPLADPAAGSDAGRAYVVYGRSATGAVQLSAVAAGVGGFGIEGQAAGAGSGLSVSAAGDVNGDGVADLVVGVRQADPAGRADAGRTYVVFGRTDAALIDLSAVAGGSGGFAIDGQAAGDASGMAAAALGDVNGDGLADLIVGACGAAPGGDSFAGESYVEFSASVPLLSARYPCRASPQQAHPVLAGCRLDGLRCVRLRFAGWRQAQRGPTPRTAKPRARLSGSRRSALFHAGAGSLRSASRPMGSWAIFVVCRDEAITGRHSGIRGDWRGVIQTWQKERDPLVPTGLFLARISR